MDLAAFEQIDAGEVFLALGEQTAAVDAGAAFEQPAHLIDAQPRELEKGLLDILISSSWNREPL